MGHRKTWALALGVIALVLSGFWALPRLMPNQEWGLGELNQAAGIASLAVAVATLAVTMWPASPGGLSDDGGNGGEGDSIDLSGIKAKGSVKAKTGPQTSRGGDRIRMRGIRADKDVIGKQTFSARERPHQ